MNHDLIITENGKNSLFFSKDCKFWEPVMIKGKHPSEDSFYKNVESCEFDFDALKAKAHKTFEHTNKKGEKSFTFYL